MLDASHKYLWWTWLIPLAGSAAFIWDGVFIGMTATRGMFVTSVLSALVFFAVYYMTWGFLGNHGLWLAQITYLSMRGLLQTVWYRFRLVNTI